MTKGGVVFSMMSLVLSPAETSDLTPVICQGSPCDPVLTVVDSLILWSRGIQGVWHLNDQVLHKIVELMTSQQPERRSSKNTHCCDCGVMSATIHLLQHCLTL